MVELPYKDISEDVIPIEESDRLIYQAIRDKYGKDFSKEDGRPSNTKIKHNKKY